MFYSGVTCTQAAVSVNMLTQRACQTSLQTHRIVTLKITSFKQINILASVQGWTFESYITFHSSTKFTVIFCDVF